MIGVEPLEPFERGFGAGKNVTAHLLRALDHDHGKPQAAGGLDLAVGSGAARVLGYEDLNLLAPHEPGLRLGVEGSTLEEDANARRQGDVGRRIDGTGEIDMLRRGAEPGKLETADGEEHAARRLAQGSGRGCGRRHDRPAIASPRLPRRADDRAERETEALARGRGVGRDLARERMRGVDDRLYSLYGEPRGEPLGAAEAADAAWKRLRRRRMRAPGERQDRAKPRIRRNEAGKLARLGGAA